MFDRGYAPLPAGLDEMEPGPELAAVLDDIDVDEVSPYDRITVLQAHARMEAHY